MNTKDGNDNMDVESNNRKKKIKSRERTKESKEISVATLRYTVFNDIQRRWYSRNFFTVYYHGPITLTRKNRFFFFFKDRFLKTGLVTTMIMRNRVIWSLSLSFSLLSSLPIVDSFVIFALHTRGRVETIPPHSFSLTSWHTYIRAYINTHTRACTYLPARGMRTCVRCTGNE